MLFNYLVATLTEKASRKKTRISSAFAEATADEARGLLNDF